MRGAEGDDEEAASAPTMDLPFGGEVGLGVASQAYWWHNKYAPRKPKYFNRCGALALGGGLFVLSQQTLCVCC
jgi:hypothetical protein